MSAEDIGQTAMRELHDLIPGAGPLAKGSELFGWPCSIHYNCAVNAITDGLKISLCCDHGADDGREFVKRLNLPRDILRKVCALLGLSPDLKSGQANTDESTPAAAAAPPKASDPRAEIERCSNLLCQPGEVYELRALETRHGGVVSGYYND